MSTIRRSLLYSFVESYMGIVLSLVSFILLARLLTPKEVGLFSVTLAIITITQVIRDFGLVSFLIQKPELSEDHIGTAWGMALILGTTLFLGIQLAAPLIGHFYGDVRLGGMARVVACNFLILPFNSVYLALLRRNMQFHIVMRINLSANLLSTSATIAGAWLGMGAFALAGGAVLNSALVACGLWLTGASAQLVRPRLTHWREVLRFGGPVTAANVVTSIAMDISDLTVGKLISLDAVAIASRAQGMMNLFHKDFMNAVRNVAYSAFAEARRTGAPMEARFTASVNNVTVVAWTFYGFAALFPLEVLRLMFGPQWDRSAPLVPFFCLAGAASATVNLVQTLIMAAGHAQQVATAELIFQPLRALALCLVVWYFRELEPLAIGFLIVSLLSVPYFYAFKQRCLPTDFAALLRNLGRNLVLCGLSLAPAVMIVLGLRAPGQAVSYPWFFTAVAATCAAWPLLLWRFRHPLYFEAMAMLKSRLDKRKTMSGE